MVSIFSCTIQMLMSVWLEATYVMMVKELAHVSTLKAHITASVQQGMKFLEGQ